jgi:hypothetical protein
MENAFATVRRRSVRAKGFLSNRAASAMIFKLAEAAEKAGAASMVTTNCRGSSSV